MNGFIGFEAVKFENREWRIADEIARNSYNPKRSAVAVMPIGTFTYSPKQVIADTAHLTAMLEGGMYYNNLLKQLPAKFVRIGIYYVDATYVQKMQISAKTVVSVTIENNQMVLTAEEKVGERTIKTRVRINEEAPIKNATVRQWGTFVQYKEMVGA